MKKTCSSHPWVPRVLKWTQAQEDVFTLGTMRPDVNFQIRACAGSAKTTTLVELANRLAAMGRRVLAVAFNKAIAEELGSRMHPLCQSSTLHSFGNAVCRDHGWRCAQVPATVTINHLRKVINSEELHGDELRLFLTERRAVDQLCALIKAHAIVEPDAASVLALADKFSVPCTLDTVGLTLETFTRSYEPQVVKGRILPPLINFDDMLFLPVKYDWDLNVVFDDVLVDEAQDLNACQHALIKKIGARVIAFGDPHQGIYGFRGADATSMDTLKSVFNMEVLPLNTSFRCPKAVVELAQELVPEIEAAPDAASGEVIETADFAPLDGDFVLCRTTAPLIKRCLELIAKRIKATVIGRDIGKALVDQIEKIEAMYGRFDADTISQFRCAMLDLARNEQARIAIEDQTDALDVIYQAFGRAAKAETEKLFSDAAGRGVSLMTVHRAKGLENRRVWIIRRDLMPHPRCKEEWEIVQEHNLMYVAYTRTLDKLFLLKEETR